MRIGFAFVCQLAILLCSYADARASTFFPTAHSGDSFAGIFSLNPNAPLSTYTTSTNFIYTNPPFIGTFSVLINGGTFSSPIDVVDAVPGIDTQWRWFLQASQ